MEEGSVYGHANVCASRIRYEVCVSGFSVLKDLRPETITASFFLLPCACTEMWKIPLTIRILSAPYTLFLKWKIHETKLSNQLSWPNTGQNMMIKMPVCHLGLSGWNRRRYWWHSGLSLFKETWTLDKWIINSKILSRKHMLFPSAKDHWSFKKELFIPLSSRSSFILHLRSIL